MLYERLSRVRDAVKDLKIDDEDWRVKTTAALRAALPEVAAVVADALEETRRAGDALAEYRREVYHAPNAYRTAAQAWRDRGDDFPTGSELRDLDYEFAEAYEKTARELPRALASADRVKEQLPALEAFLKDYKQFLTDFAIYMRAVLDAEGGESLTRFLDHKRTRHKAIDEYPRPRR